MMQQPLVGQVPFIIDASRSHSDTPHSVGLLWPRDLPIAEISTSQQSQETNVQASGGIRTRNPSNRLAADARHRPRGHWGAAFLKSFEFVLTTCVYTTTQNSVRIHTERRNATSYKDLAYYQTYKEPRYQ
jgi:hypothetical protein